MVETLEVLSKELETFSDMRGFVNGAEDVIRKYAPSKIDGIGTSAYCKEVPCQCITVKCY
jgi:hypothetical protein